MPERMRTRRTKQTKRSKLSREEKTISADFHIKDVYGNLPRWAIVLAGLRYREDLTQKQLGEMIGVKQSNISLMERGLRPIGKHVAQRLARVFKTDYRIFL